MKKALIVCLYVVSLAAVGYAYIDGGLPARDGGEFTVPSLGQFSAERAALESYFFVPALLTTVYNAFGRVDEEGIYDTLALVADGDALETLYLERASALGDGGLTQSDQTIHELNVTKVKTVRNGNDLALDTVWEVIGTVGHSEHEHVRGNTYRANLAVTPVDGAWKIVDFALLEVDRRNAGEAIEAVAE